MSRFRTVILCLVLVGLIIPVSGKAQGSEEALTLTLHRDFGFGGGSKIEGNFTLRAEGPPALVEVEFRIDDEPVGEDVEAPFRYSFHTADFPTGPHTFLAVGRLADGRMLESNTITYVFLSSEEAKLTMTKIVVPILAVTLGVIVVGSLVSFFIGRNRSFELGRYSMAGGTVCPRCEFPYSRSVFSPNLVVGKLGRCPHCGKWSIGRRASPQELDQAEARFRRDSENGPEVTTESADEKMRRLLDESRFDR
jgi:hypothetical protein